MKYLIILLLLSSCMPSYQCMSTDGSSSIARIKTHKETNYLKTKTVEQICEIIRKEIGD